MEPVDGGLGGLRLVEEEVVPPWVKDYDAFEEEGPARWGRRWDLRNWVVLAAFDKGNRVGGCKWIFLCASWPAIHKITDHQAFIVVYPGHDIVTV